MITVLKKSALLCMMLLTAFTQSVVAEDLRIIGEDKSFVATLPSGENDAKHILRRDAGCHRA